MPSRISRAGEDCRQPGNTDDTIDDMYAHALIELHNRTIHRGDEVQEDELTPEDFAALVEGEALRDEEYYAAADVSATPDVIEIDGVRYTKESTDE